MRRNRCGGNEIVGEDHAIAPQRRVHLHVLVQPEAEEMRHALAHVDHRQRRAGARFDDLEQRGVLQSDAVRLQPDFDDGLADVIGDGGFGRAAQQGAGRSQREPATFKTLSLP